MSEVSPEQYARMTGPTERLLRFLLENAQVGISNSDVVVNGRSYPAPSEVRIALADQMERTIEGDPA